MRGRQREYTPRSTSQSRKSTLPIAIKITNELKLTMEQCPRNGRSCSYAQDNMMPNDLERDKVQGLSAERVSSSIPKANAASTWTYPSAQMFYAALERKGQKLPDKQDMDAILAIHNIVNEQTWQAVLRWEKTHLNEGEDVKLERFLGRPDATSPRAWFRHHLMGYKRPFDRHDWYVRRAGGELVRYVIDYYEGKQVLEGVPAVYIDARPALDTFAALRDRLSFLFN